VLGALLVLVLLVLQVPRQGPCGLLQLLLLVAWRAPAAASEYAMMLMHVIMVLVSKVITASSFILCCMFGSAR
jgi:hypothetical protein